jgi:hypothetical protein
MPVVSPSDPVEVKIGPWRVGVTVRGFALAVGLLAAGTAGAAGLARTAGLATSEEVGRISVAVSQAQATVAARGPRVEAIERSVAEHATALRLLSDSNTYLIRYTSEDIAERIADRAADPIKDAKHSREVWRIVKAKVLENIAAHRPARDGIGELP